MFLDDLVSDGIRSLLSSYDIHEELGIEGEAKVQKNQFGEMALLVDVKAEEAVISVLKAAHCPIRLISEEHGVLDLGASPTLLGVLDGLDGSSVYALQRGKGRYGTMLGIFSNLEPHYDDYLFCGVMIHSPKQELLYASKGGGCFIIVNGERRITSCSNVTNLQETTKIYVDEYFDINREVFTRRLEGFELECTHSSAVHYTDVARGAADAALECTRKQNLEMAVAYGLITESNGVMVTLDGVSIGDRPYRTFSPDSHTPIVTASTLKLALHIIEHVTSQKLD